MFDRPFLITIVIMFVVALYELSKQFLSQDIQIWSYGCMVIIAFSAIACAYLVSRKLPLPMQN